MLLDPAVELLGFIGVAVSAVFTEVLEDDSGPADAFVSEEFIEIQDVDVDGVVVGLI